MGGFVAGDTLSTFGAPKGRPGCVYVFAQFVFCPMHSGFRVQGNYIGLRVQGVEVLPSRVCLSMCPRRLMLFYFFLLLLLLLLHPEALKSKP